MEVHHWARRLREHADAALRACRDERFSFWLLPKVVQRRYLGLRDAAALGDTPDVSRLLRAALRPERVVPARPSGYTTAVHEAARRGQLGTLDALLAATRLGRYAYVEDVGTPLHVAAESGTAVTAEVVGMLVACGYSPCWPVGSASPLAAAAAHGNLAAVTALLGAGASPDVVLPDGQTLLGQAVTTCDVELTRLLLAAGARHDRHDRRGRHGSLLGLAARHASTAAGRRLLVVLIRSGAATLDADSAAITDPAAMQVCVAAEHLRTSAVPPRAWAALEFLAADWSGPASALVQAVYRRAGSGFVPAPGGDAPPVAPAAPGGTGEDWANYDQPAPVEANWAWDENS